MNYCVNCGKEADEQHHIVPLALGGNDIESNKVWLCAKCHNIIHNRSLSMGKLAASSPKYRQAVAEHRVGRPSQEKTPEFMEAYKQWKNNEITATQAIKESKMSRTTFYKLVKLLNK